MKVSEKVLSVKLFRRRIFAIKIFQGNIDKGNICAIIKIDSTKTECKEVREQTNGIGQGCSTMPLKNDIVLFCLNGGENRCKRQPNRKRRERRERL